MFQILLAIIVLNCVFIVHGMFCFHKVAILRSLFVDIAIYAFALKQRKSTWKISNNQKSIGNFSQKIK